MRPIPLLRDDMMLPESVVHWVVAPYFPEHWMDYVFPLKLGDRIIYAASSGLVLSLPSESGKAVAVDGRTGEFSSKFRIDRIGSKYVMEGTYAGQPITYKVSLSAGRIEVSGTGKFEADFAVVREAPETWHVEGQTGEFSSNYTVTVKSNEEISVRGIKRSERMDYTVFRDDDALRFEGRMGDKSSQFVLKPDSGALTIEGTMNDEATSVRLETDGTDIKVVGATPWGKVNYQIQGEGDQILVKGRVHKWFVNYRLDCAAEA